MINKKWKLSVQPRNFPPEKTLSHFKPFYLCNRLCAKSPVKNLKIKQAKSCKTALI